MTKYQPYIGINIDVLQKYHDNIWSSELRNNPIYKLTGQYFEIDCSLFVHNFENLILDWEVNYVIHTFVSDTQYIILEVNF